MESKKYIMVGSYDCTNGEQKINREYYRQGYIYKNENAYLSSLDQVCYIPELHDSTYTHQDFLDLCNGQEEFAKQCFDAVDWQSPETFIDEQYREEEWGVCVICGGIYNIGGGEKFCSHCKSINFTTYDGSEPNVPETKNLEQWFSWYEENIPKSDYPNFNCWMDDMLKMQILIQEKTNEKTTD